MKKYISIVLIVLTVFTVASCSNSTVSDASKIVNDADNFVNDAGSLVNDAGELVNDTGSLVNGITDLIDGIGRLADSISVVVDRIKDMSYDNEKYNDCLTVLPNGKNFSLVDITGMGLAETVTEVYTEKNGGTVVKLTATGFNPNMTLMVGVNADGTVSGATCISSEETLGYEKTYGENVLGATLDTIDSVDTVSGATKTTVAYRSAVKDALNAAASVNGR